MDEQYKILVVDDEQFILSALARAMRKENFTSDFISEPEKALLKLREQPYDIVVSDHLMPNMTGLEFLKQVRKEHPETLRIILTGHADMEMIIEAINEGQIYRFITKPWNDEELRITLRIALQHHHSMEQNRNLEGFISKQLAYIEDLERKYPGISVVEKDEEGVIHIDMPESA